jgi:hypothetical protein
MSNDLTKRFHEAMLDIHAAAKRLSPPYNAYGFLRMVQEHGGKETADRLLATGDPSEGFTQLYLRGKENLKISVEYLVLRDPWRELFEQDQLAVARKRLLDVKCDPPPEDGASPAN